MSDETARASSAVRGHAPSWFAGVAFVILAALPLACGDDRVAPSDDDARGGGGSASTTTTSGVTTTGTGGMTPLPASFVVEGIVVDEDGTPVADAIILQGGKSHEPTLTSAADGSYSIEVDGTVGGVPGIVATKIGHRSYGEQFFTLPDGPITLTLRRVNLPDNPAYEYEQPGTGVGDPTTDFCGHCHETFAQRFQLSMHRQATSDVQVQDVYAGVAASITSAAACAAVGGIWRNGLVVGTTASASKCYLGDGVLPDLNQGCGGPAELACDDPALAQAPTAFGACADCHAPGISGMPGGRNLHDAVGIAYDNGVFCDVCHKIRDIDPAMPAGVGAGLRLLLQRPSEPFNNPTAAFRPLFFGPLIDVSNGIMGASYQPIFKEAAFCSGCHQHKQPALIAGQSLDAARWPDGLDVHSTYDEWLAGPYAQAGTPCQFCHMPPHFELTNTIDTATPDNVSITFGYARPAEDIREHVFRGPLYSDGIEPRLADTALFIDVVASVNGTTLSASVSANNVGCGHALPTGEPMRTVVLLVDAVGGGCGPLTPLGGHTIYDAGGAHAAGVEGSGVSSAGAVVTWPAGAAAAQPGMVVRAVRPKGVFDDYPAVGLFATLAAVDKGIEIHDPVANAAVVSVGAGQLTLSAPLGTQPGDVLYLGDAFGTPSDGQSALALAGAPGNVFARVMVDQGGARNVLHHRAIDIASDNRIPPGKAALSNHTFTLPNGCSDATVRVWALYRSLPIAEAALRGWPSQDHLIASAQETVLVP